jgi:hypothetical protein
MNGLHDDSVAGEHSRVDAMTAVPRFVFLVDVDNTRCLTMTEGISADKSKVSSAIVDTL